MLTDLRKLQHVVAVARAESFTAAASVLAITQSALTKSVADVEHLLDVRLFQRLPRGVRLTEAGSLFVPRAERILADTGDLMSEIGDLKDLRAGRLRIGVAPAAYVSFLENTMDEFARRYPGVRVAVDDGAIDATAQALMTGQVDIAIGGANYLDAFRELTVEHVAPLHHYFITRRDHPVAAHSTPTAADLLAYPVIVPAAGMPTRDQLARAYAAADMTPVEPTYVCDHFPLVRRLVLATDAISPVVSLAPPGTRYQGEFRVFEDVVALDPQALGIAHASARVASPAAEAFAALFRERIAVSPAGEPISGPT